MKINGKVVHVALEGGFWGIKGNNGKEYLPVPSLPEEFRKDGLSITARAEKVQVMSMNMWGETVKLSEIQVTS